MRSIWQGFKICPVIRNRIYYTLLINKLSISFFLIIFCFCNLHYLCIILESMMFMYFVVHKIPVLITVTLIVHRYGCVASPHFWSEDGWRSFPKRSRYIWSSLPICIICINTILILFSIQLLIVMQYCSTSIARYFSLFMLTCYINYM